MQIEKQRLRPDPFDLSGFSIAGSFTGGALGFLADVLVVVAGVVFTLFVVSTGVCELHLHRDHDGLRRDHSHGRRAPLAARPAADRATSGRLATVP